MGLLKKFFGKNEGGREAAPESSLFHESETTAQHLGSRNAPHRELVQVVLRDTMRKHGIPSDWIDCRILSVVTRNRVAGMHVQFIVGKQQSVLLDYVHAFQDSFWEELERFEPRARDWLFSVAWQFDGPAPASGRSMPRPSGWGALDSTRDGDTQPPDMGADELESDLRALYAIRDAALSQPGDTAPQPAAPAPAPGRSETTGW